MFCSTCLLQSVYSVMTGDRLIQAYLALESILCAWLVVVRIIQNYSKPWSESLEWQWETPKACYQGTHVDIAGKTLAEVARELTEYRSLQTFTFPSSKNSRPHPVLLLDKGLSQLERLTRMILTKWKRDEILRSDQIRCQCSFEEQVDCSSLMGFKFMTLLEQHSMSV